MCRRLRFAVGFAVMVGSATSLSLSWPDWPQAKVFQEKLIRRASAEREARDMIADWPDGSRLLASSMIEKYGPPDESLPSQLSWRDRPPWKEMAVFREPSSRTLADTLLQSVAYDAPAGRWQALSAFDCGVTYDAVGKQLVARSDSEEASILALNLADEVIRGRRGPEQARAFYDMTLELSYSGKSSRYMRKLLFRPSSR